MNQENVQQKISGLIDSTTKCARQVLEEGDVGQQLKRLVNQTETTIRKYPVKSVVAGVIGGFVIGKILS